jgi:hypothetical protein
VESSGIYLNDHLAGAAAGIRLAKRCRDRLAGSRFQRTLDGLVAQVEEDRITLEQVMEAAGTPPDQLKQIGAIAVEVASRVIHALAVLGTRSNTIALLEEIEVLSLGIEGKRLLWTVLGRTSQSVGRFGRFDFGALEARARSQRDRLEQVRIELAIYGLRRLRPEE